MGLKIIVMSSALYYIVFCVDLELEIDANAGPMQGHESQKRLNDSVLICKCFHIIIRKGSTHTGNGTQIFISNQVIIWPWQPKWAKRSNLPCWCLVVVFSATSYKLCVTIMTRNYLLWQEWGLQHPSVGTHKYWMQVNWLLAFLYDFCLFYIALYMNNTYCIQSLSDLIVSNLLHRLVPFNGVIFQLSCCTMWTHLCTASENQEYYFVCCKHRKSELWSRAK